MKIASSFTHESAEFLAVTYLLRLDRALQAIGEEDLWWSPHASAISIGTILRHLEGNVRQWILSGLRGDADDRVRKREFEPGEGGDAKQLMAQLRSTVESAAQHIQGMTAPDLEAQYSIQGNNVTGLYAVLHVVEHFSWHTGQAVWIAKARAGMNHGIQFYDEDAINAAKNKQ